MSSHSLRHQAQATSSQVFWHQDQATMSRLTSKSIGHQFTRKSDSPCHEVVHSQPARLINFPKPPARYPSCKILFSQKPELLLPIAKKHQAQAMSSHVIRHQVQATSSHSLRHHA